MIKFAKYALEIYYENEANGYPKQLIGMDVIWVKEKKDKAEELMWARCLGTTKYAIEGYTIVVKKAGKEA